MLQSLHFVQNGVSLTTLCCSVPWSLLPAQQCKYAVTIKECEGEANIKATQSLSSLRSVGPSVSASSGLPSPYTPVWILADVGSQNRTKLACSAPMDRKGNVPFLLKT